MPLEPQTQAIIAALAANPIDLTALPPAEARKAFREMNTAIPSAPVELASVEDRSIPMDDGAQIGVRIYRPAAGTLPVLVYFHGGGWVIGDLETHDGTCRELARDVGCVVVAVDYRLAPETKFPRPARDCLGAVRWVADHATELDVDPARIAVGGDSAGGNLGAVTALQARDAGGPPLCFQLLIYPVTDFAFDTKSYADNATGYFLEADAMRWFWGHYLADDVQGDDPIASPLRAKDLAGLPPALVITAEYDPLRDEGEAYAERMRAAGVPVQISRYDGTVHGFFAMTAVLDIAKRAVAEAAGALRATFGSAR